MAKRSAKVSAKECVACGCCVKVCPRGAISINHGIYAVVDTSKCIGCGLCVKECPASIIELTPVEVIA
ncbi:MAG: 4Fe-4S binding protein [Clostridiaceae bacterium]|nr:4Fe-4S binding protein [Clostridiaceae bacterium]